MRLLKPIALLVLAEPFIGCALLGIKPSRELPPPPAISDCENLGGMIYCLDHQGKEEPPVDCSKAEPMHMTPVQDWDVYQDWIEVLKK